ncbi:MAG: sugar nucleotide-binding protein [Candidatus Omnitrophota bacterium]
MGNKILILGKGFIGDRLAKELPCDVSTKRINSFKDADQIIEEFRPKIIINCIGHTGLNNVDGCERDIDKTLQANTFVPIILAETALRRNVKLAHISSGCVYHFDYSKDKPIGETREPDFYDLFYSRSKIYSEGILGQLAKRYNMLIARIRVPIDSIPHPKNTLTKLIAYRKIIDIPNSITYIPDFMNALKHLLKIDARGIYNIVTKGALRYPDLLDAYKKYVPGFTYETIDLTKLKLVRTNLILSAQKLQKSGFNVRPTKEILEECVKNYIKYS